MKFIRNFCVLSSRSIPLVQQNVMTSVINNSHCVPKRMVKMLPPSATKTTTTVFNQKQQNAAGEPTTVASDSKFQPFDIIHKLSDSERESLRQALEYFDADQMKHKLEGNIFFYSYNIQMLSH